MTVTKTATWSLAGSKTLSVSPTVLGDIMIMTGISVGATGVTAVSGGGVTTWSHIIGPFGSGGVLGDMWIGIVTATGASTITATSAITAANTFMDCTQFSAGPGFLWTVDTTGTRTNAAVTTVTCPTLVPAVSGEMYFGAGFSNTGTLSTPSAGYTFFTGASTGFGFIFNVSVTGSQTPTYVQSSAGTPSVLAVLLKYALPSTSTGWFDMFE